MRSAESRGRGRQAVGWVTALLLLAAGACRRQPPTSRPNLVLVVLDTVRRDATHGTGASPELDRLERRGTLFTNAWANGPWTVPSHASLFTGLLPVEHGCDSLDPRLRTPRSTLAELLGRSGYETAAFFSNPWLSDQLSGLLRGFQLRSEGPTVDPAGMRHGDQGGANTLERVQEWLARRRDARPFFLFVNLLEAHLPYDPPVDWRQREGLDPETIVDESWAHEFNAGLHPAASQDWARLRRLYTGDVYAADRLLGALLRLVETEGPNGNTVIAVTSDHGENLGDHGLVEHQFGIHETLLAVPLVVLAPGRLAPGVRNDPVMLSDLFATLLELAAVAADSPRRFSRSLLGPSAPSDRPVFAEYAGAPPSLLEMLQRMNPHLDAARLAPGYSTVRVGQVRLTLSDSGTAQLHDLAADPAQQRDIAAERSGVVGVLEELLRQAQAGRVERHAEPLPIDEELRERLRSLGYVR